MQRNAWLPILAMLFGFLGGLVSNAIRTDPVFAQEKPVKSLEAQEFRVVDQDGVMLGRFGIAAGHGTITLLDRNGRVIWSQPQPLFQPLQKP